MHNAEPTPWKVPCENCPLRGRRYFGSCRGHDRIDAIDPDVWSGRASQEGSSIWRMWSCINVSGL
jgi:hypothetical protein